MFGSLKDTASHDFLNGSVTDGTAVKFALDNQSVPVGFRNYISALVAAGLGDVGLPIRPPSISDAEMLVGDWIHPRNKMKHLLIGHFIDLTLYFASGYLQATRMTPSTAG